MQPIETHYAGCRFRSRLEARWAVFFDRLGAHWQYEPQGFEIAGRPYLPDFLLTDCGTWVEVKGNPDDLDRDFIEAAALELPRMPCRLEGGPRLMLLGPIPDPPETDLAWMGFDPAHDEHGETVVVSSWFGFGLYWKNHRPWRLYNTSSGTPHVGWESPSEWLKPAVEMGEPGAPEEYRAARSARFEHGEAPQ